MTESQSIRVKVCGMRDPENILKIAALEPDYMGFIFYEGSRRFVGNDFTIPEDFPTGIQRVGVFVNQPVDGVLKLGKQHGLDLIQLHGVESTAYCQTLRQEGFRLCKAFSIGDSFTFNELVPYASIVDYFLFDTKGKNVGGNGISFDWNILRQYNQAIPFFLSGGIGPDSLNNLPILKGMNIHALDINSGVEKAEGFKDVDRTKEIINSKQLAL